MSTRDSGVLSASGQTPTKFGKHVTADWLDAKNKLAKGIGGEMAAFICWDVGSEWLYVYLSKDRDKLSNTVAFSLARRTKEKG